MPRRSPPAPVADTAIQTILAVAREAAGTLNRAEILTRVQRRVAEALHCAAVVTFYWDPGFEGFRVVAHHGVPEPLAAGIENLTFPPHEPFGGRISAGETLVTSDLDAWPGLPRALLDAAGARSIMVAPLVVGGINIGRLVAIRTDREFAESDRPLFEGIALQLALALETADLYRAKEEEAEVHVALSRLGRELLAASSVPAVLDILGQATLRLLRADTAVLFLPDEDGRRLVPAVEDSGDARTPRIFASAGLPVAAFGSLVRSLPEVGTVYVADTAAGDAVSRHAAAHGFRRILYIGLRRGDELLGIQAALFRDQAPLAPVQTKIATGMAQLASFGVAGARLVHQLDHANRVKTDFVATMSHELRSPLNVILGYTDLLLEGAFGDLNDEQTDTLQRVQSRGWELLELINTTLDLSRFASGHVSVDRRSVDVAALLAEVEEESRDAATTPAVRFEVVAPAEPAVVETDGPKLKVVLRNLVRNALKFTEAGSVRVSAVRDGDRLRFSVADTGIGIPAAARDTVFEAFRQVDNSMTRRYGGAGLGLYIVRQLVDLLGGEIRFDSDVGRGTTFHVWIPLHSGEAAAATGRSA